MKSPRLVRFAACAVAALAVLVAPALADELIGRITAVNVDAKTLTVLEKGTDKEIEVTVTDDTVVERGKNKSAKIDLPKMQKAVAKAKDGLSAEITHEKGVASKIVQKGNGKNKKKNDPAKATGKLDESK